MQIGNYRFLTLSVLTLGGTVAGCSGLQSALDPAGHGAQQIATLFWWMTGVGAVIWLAVVGLATYAIVISPGRHRKKWSKLLILGGGVAFPTVVLTILLVYGLVLLPKLLAPAPPGSLSIAVTGEQWWWRVRYPSPTGEAIELANEIYLPVAEPVDFQLESADVIHSFWVPALGGKVDMIPGRRTRLTLQPTRLGHFRGVCAEYCGSSHALMGFNVVVVEKEDFARWLSAQAAGAQSPTSAAARNGQELFLSTGCGACHAVRGTAAKGKVGPDLTHVGSRSSIGAGLLGTRTPDFIHWLTHADHLKPEVFMPAFAMLQQDDLEAIAAYLEELK